MNPETRGRRTIVLSVTMAIALVGGVVATGCATQQRASQPGRVEQRSPRPSDEARQAAEQARLAKLDSAEQAKDSGDYGTALNLFREILAENPTVTTAYLGIGDIYMEKGEYASAEPAYARAARLEPRNFNAQYGHGLALQMLRRFVDAVKAYHRALVIRPESPDANLNLATTYLQMGEPHSAKVFAERAVELDGERGEARVNLGAVYDELGMHNEAIEQYRAAMELVEPTPEMVLNLVQSLSKARRYRETIEAAETLNRMEPSANAYERIGYAWFRLKDYEKSLEAYRQAVEVDPGHWPSWNGIGVNALNRWLLSKKRDIEARNMAGDALRQSLRINADQPRIVQLLSTYRM